MFLTAGALAKNSSHRQDTLHHLRQVGIVTQQGIRLKPGNTGALGAEGDKHDRHARGPRRVPIRHRIPDEKRATDIPTRAQNGLPIGFRVGFAAGKRICADQRLEQPTHAEAGKKCLRQRLGLVGADAHPVPPLAERFHGLHRAGIEAGVTVDILGIGLEQQGKIRVNIRLAPLPSQPRKP